MCSTPKGVLTLPKIAGTFSDLCVVSLSLIGEEREKKVLRIRLDLVLCYTVF